MVVHLLSLCSPFEQWGNTAFLPGWDFLGKTKISYLVVVFMRPMCMCNLYNACVGMHEWLQHRGILVLWYKQLHCKVRDNREFDTLFCAGWFYVQLCRISLRHDLGVALK